METREVDKEVDRDNEILTKEDLNTSFDLLCKLEKKLGMFSTLIILFMTFVIIVGYKINKEYNRSPISFTIKTLFCSIIILFPIYESLTGYKYRMYILGY